MPIQTSKFFSRYLPLTLSILLLVGLGFVIYFWQQPGEQTAKDNAGQNQSFALLSEKEEQAVKANNNFYSDEQFNFGFWHPKEISLARFEEGEGVALIFNQNNQSFAQGYISEFDEQGPITKERILKDLPDKVIENPAQTKIGGNETFVFFSREDKGLNMREYWFVRNFYLYRFSVLKEQDEIFQKILNTWQNEN